MKLHDLTTLGRSGLPVSPLALGTMTMGNADWGNADWGNADDVSRSIFDAYVDAGGNFIDTADIYAGGRSEELIGEWIAARKLRDNVILATKYGWNTGKNHPMAGGNGRKNVYRALKWA